MITRFMLILKNFMEQENVNKIDLYCTCEFMSKLYSL